MYGSALSMDIDKFVKGLLMPGKHNADNESISIVATRAAQHDTTKAYRTHYNQCCCLHRVQRDTTIPLN